MSQIINKLIERIKQITSVDIAGEEFVLFNKQGYKPYPIDKKNFHSIEDADADNRIAFVDGGNMEILASSNFSLQLVRTYYNIYHINKKIRAQLFELFVLVYSVVKENEIYYEFDLFPIKGNLDLDKLSFGSNDRAICTGNSRASPSKIAEIIRRLLELKTAEYLTGCLDSGSIIVMDGTLEANTSYEALSLKSIYHKSRSKNIIITSLAKTSRLFTNKGNNLLPILADIAPAEGWYYYPIADIDDENYQADLYLVKLNHKSSFIFRFETYKNSNFDLKTILALLYKNSTDPSFFGYPYGLIDADRFARVTKQEKTIFEARLIAKFGSSFAGLKKHLNSINAHDILDSF